jgi:hypothetical protein
MPVDALAPEVAPLPDAGRSQRPEFEDADSGWLALRAPEDAAVGSIQPEAARAVELQRRSQVVQAVKAHSQFELRFAVVPESLCAPSVLLPAAVLKAPAEAGAAWSRPLAGSLPRPAALQMRADRLP